MDRQTISLGLGGGCHWCTEAVISALRGTLNVQQGFISSTPPHDGPSEGVLLDLDEGLLPVEALIEVHLRTHASQSDHSMRGKYRSAIYAASDELAERCEQVLVRLAPKFEAPLVTMVLPLVHFDLNDAQFLRYQETRPNAPFCKTYIDPKLALLKREYGRLLSDPD